MKKNICTRHANLMIIHSCQMFINGPTKRQHLEEQFLQAGTLHVTQSPVLKCQRELAVLSSFWEKSSTVIILSWSIKGYLISQIWFRIHSKTSFRFSEKVHSVCKSDTGFRFGVTFHVMRHCCLFTRITLFTAKRPFNLPSKSEMVSM